MARPADLDRQALQGRARRRCRRWTPSLRDPKSDNADQQPAYVKKANPELRSIKPEISVLVGLCTHLGCSPEIKAEIRPEPFDPEWKGGYFCPCHKSRFDMAGRVFQGVPAPTNLVVPPHYYENDTTIIIGVDPKAGPHKPWRTSSPVPPMA